MDNLTETINIIQIIDNKQISKDDVIIKEAPLTLFLNDQELVTLLCTPNCLKNLAVGFLFSEGIIKSKSEILNIIQNESRGIVWVTLNNPIELDDNFKNKRTVTSGCARGLSFHNIFDKWSGEEVTSKLTIDSKTIFNIISSLNQNSVLFKKTGGTHSSILFKNNEIITSAEDIGRHNTIDKIIGECLLNNIPGNDKLLLCSGRISSEMLLKTARWNIPILISRSAPTSAAIKLADEIGITLIGFARSKRMNIYAHSWRIKKFNI